jgi:dihydroorotate dehydrogenase
MGGFYRGLFGAGLSRLDAERAHRLGFAALRVAAGVPGLLALAGARPPPTGEAIQAFGLTFPGPLGIAAGFDKNAVGVDALAALGFGFIEVGTVTGQAQPGNERPRLFRLMADRAVVNRMGFNNDGAAAVADRLAARRGRRRHRDVIVGVNIGKSKAVADDDAVADYELSARLLAPYADYLVVNVSSPNTPGLRDLQAVGRLRPLLLAVREQADTAARRHVPLLVKISPDLSDDEVVAVAHLAVEVGLDGIVAVNTTVRRGGLRSPADEVEAAGPGGLSGPPLRARALEVLRLLRQHVETMPIISVGGVSTADDVVDRLAAGAVLVQAYTAFVYEGPAWPARVQRAVERRRRERPTAHG